MKLIIDIPENDLDNFLNKCIVTRSFINSIADFITLDSVIDDVKTEIVALPKTYPFVNHIDAFVKEDDVMQILDNIGKAESEDKE